MEFIIIIFIIDIIMEIFNKEEKKNLKNKTNLKKKRKEINYKNLEGRNKKTKLIKDKESLYKKNIEKRENIGRIYKDKVMSKWEDILESKYTDFKNTDLPKGYNKEEFLRARKNLRPSIHDKSIKFLRVEENIFEDKKVNSIKKKRKSNVRLKMNKDSLLNGIIIAEILSEPKCKK